MSQIDDFLSKSTYIVSKGAIRIPLDRPIPKRLLKLLITARLKAIRSETRG